jgi:hypothetical protein
MNIEDRMISRSRNLATPPARIQDLAPRLLQCLPDTACGVADRLNATRQEVLDAVEALEDRVANRGGLLVPRDRRLSAWDARDGFYTR